MSVFSYTHKPLLIILVAVVFLRSTRGSCRHVVYQPAVKGKALINHTIETIPRVQDEITCSIQCYLNPACFSYNHYIKSRNNPGEAVCELNESDETRHPMDLTDSPDSTYVGFKTTCSSSRCPSNAKCQGDFLGDPVPHRCVCVAGFTGQDCESDIDECVTNTYDCHVEANCNNTIGSYGCVCKTGYQGNGRDCHDINECTSNTHNCDTNAICNNTIGGYTCTCKRGVYGNGIVCQYPKTCDEVIGKLSIPNPTDGNYQMESTEGEVVDVFCLFSSIQGCGSGPWALALKINGIKNTLMYTSPLWTDKNTLNPDSFTTVFDDNSEIKLPAYWIHPVTKVCLGMKYNNVLNWISVSISTPSLYSLFKSGQEKQTNSGRVKWASLISQTSLQYNCNKEGINIKCGRTTRIGYLTNNENDCRSCDSVIGFGLGDKGCGNIISHPTVKLKLPFCYVLIQ